MLTLQNKIDSVLDYIESLSIRERGLQSVSWTIDAPFEAMVELGLESEFSPADEKMYARIKTETVGYNVVLFVRSEEKFDHIISIKNKK